MVEWQLVLVKGYKWGCFTIIEVIQERRLSGKIRKPCWGLEEETWEKPSHGTGRNNLLAGRGGTSL